MNKVHLDLLCQHFNLGFLINPVTRIYGGLRHIMWKIDTNNGSYVIKQLASDINLTDNNIIANYNLTEKIASCFIKDGIPAICALSRSGKALFIIDTMGYLVYPYVDAKSLLSNEVSIHHILNIANILAKIHHIDLNIPEMADPKFDVHDDVYIVEVIKQVSEYNFSFTENLNKNCLDILNINQKFLESITLLQQNSVISHGDLDIKNVLWINKKKPLLIDWESTRRLNPTYEIVNAALDWAGISTSFDKNLFHEMIICYRQAGGKIEKKLLKAAFYGILGNWINWMVYNINRSMNLASSEEKNIGIEQVILVLPMILKIKNLMQKLIDEIQI